MTPGTIIYWTRFVLALLTGLLDYRLQLHGFEGILIAAAIYAVSCAWVRFVHTEAELGGKHKFLSIGVGTYVFTWAAVWVFLYTLWRY